MAVKILYVEDNKMNFLLVKKILSVYDVDVHHAENGGKAVKIAEQEKPSHGIEIKNNQALFRHIPSSRIGLQHR